MTQANDRATWLTGGNAICSVLPPDVTKPSRLVLLGPPGVGKGTQAELLCHHLGACHLSTGDVFRAAKCLPPGQQTPALQTALKSMAVGELVSDQTVLSMVRERKKCLACHAGFLLDGFPRTVAQAEALEKLLTEEHIPLTAVINYELPLEKIIARLSGRRTCGKCKAVFHVTSRPPAVEGICDHCGGALVQREDDKPQAISVRMAAYQESTLPLINFYKKRGQLISVPASGTPEEGLAATLKALDKFTAQRAG